MKRVRTACARFRPCSSRVRPRGVRARCRSCCRTRARRRRSARRSGSPSSRSRYHRPAVNKRKIWGELVPYGDVWRAGANENTTLSASTPFTFGGKAVPAGTYGLHVLPAEGDWTVILSSEAKAWGSFSYDQKEDVVRVSVEARAGGLRRAARLHLRRAHERRDGAGAALGEAPRRRPDRDRHEAGHAREHPRAAPRAAALLVAGLESGGRLVRPQRRHDGRGDGVGGPVDLDAADVREPADEGRRSSR